MFSTALRCSSAGPPKENARLSLDFIPLFRSLSERAARCCAAGLAVENDVTCGVSLAGDDGVVMGDFESGDGLAEEPLIGTLTGLA